MSRPVFLVVSADPRVGEPLARDLRRRFEADYEVLTAGSGTAAETALRELSRDGRRVALAFADQALPDTPAVDVLGAARRWHPAAKRVLVVPRGDWSPAQPVIAAMARGQVDFHLYAPWYPLERILFPSVSGYLSAWDTSQDAPVVPIRIVGAWASSRAHEIRDFLTRASVPYLFYEPSSPEGRALLDELGVDAAVLPVVAFYSGEVFRDPSDADVVTALGMKTQPDVAACDVLVVGGGPAGLAAAVYAASEGLHTVVLEPVVPGGQAGTSSLIRNYLGFPHGVSGSDLTNRAVEQAWLFGVDFVLTQRAATLRVDGPRRSIITVDGSEVAARVVVLATGVSWRRLEVAPLEALLGAGVFYGAAGAEARAMAGREVFVVGAGNSAGQAVLHLARYAASVTLLVRRDSLAATMSAYLIGEIEAASRIKVRFGAEAVDGQERDGALSSLTLRDRATGRHEVVPADALFVMIGAEPRTHWLEGAVHRDPGGYLCTGLDVMDGGRSSAGWSLERPPLSLETSVPGVFAAGDVRSGSVKRVASAVGEGATAVQQIHRYLEEQDVRAPGGDRP